MKAKKAAQEGNRDRHHAEVRRTIGVEQTHAMRYKFDVAEVQHCRNYRK